MGGVKKTARKIKLNVQCPVPDVVGIPCSLPVFGSTNKCRFHYVEELRDRGIVDTDVVLAVRQEIEYIEKSRQPKRIVTPGVIAEAVVDLDKILETH